MLSKLLGLTLFDVNRNRHNKPVFKWYYGLVSIFLWLLLLPFLILQFIGFFWLFNFLRIGGMHRVLSEIELKELKLVFGKSINYSLVRVREQSIWAKYGSHFVTSPHLGFVFLNTVHFSRTVDSVNSQFEMAWLVHEVTHISQYQKYGIVYILKALRAQRNGGYNYQQEWLNTPLKDFNFEQQADIAKCYYLGLKTEQNMKPYEQVMSQIKAKSYC